MTQMMQWWVETTGCLSWLPIDVVAFDGTRYDMRSGRYMGRATAFRAWVELRSRVIDGTLSHVCVRFTEPGERSSRAFVADDSADSLKQQMANVLGPDFKLDVDEFMGKVRGVDHPPHYASGPIECIDVIDQLGLGYRLGNAMKYIWRAGRKGSRIEDLRKARWYLDREIAACEAEVKP